METNKTSTEVPAGLQEVMITEPIPTTSTSYLLKEKIGELNQALLSEHPKMPVLLKEIWLACRKHPENVTLLSEEETRIIFQSLEKQMGIHMAEKVTEKKGGTGVGSKIAQLKKLGAAAF